MHPLSSRAILRETFDARARPRSVLPFLCLIATLAFSTSSFAADPAPAARPFGSALRNRCSELVGRLSGRVGAKMDPPAATGNDFDHHVRLHREIDSLSAQEAKWPLIMRKVLSSDPAERREWATEVERLRDDSLRPVARRLLPEVPEEEAVAALRHETLARAARAVLPGVPEATAISELEQMEKLALSALWEVEFRGPEAGAAPVREWLAQVRSSQTQGGKPSVMAHNALTYALKTGFIEKIGGPELVAEARDVLRRSWKELSGREVGDAALIARLPRRVLARASHKERVFQKAIFSRNDLNLFGRLAQSSRNYVPMPQDPVIALGLLATLFSQSHATQALAGFAEGYAFASAVSYFAHEIVGHSSPAAIKSIKGWSRPLGEVIENWTAAHGGTHHFEFSKSYTHRNGDFDPAAGNYMEQVKRNREKLEKLTQKRLATIADFEHTLKTSKNGSTFGEPLLNAAIALPFSTAMVGATHYVAPLVGLHPNWVFDVSAIAGAKLFIPSVMYFHKALHMPVTLAAKTADPFMKRFMKTRYARLSSLKHAIHHRDGHANIGLGTGMELDQLLGTDRVATVGDLLRLDVQDALY